MSIPLPDILESCPCDARRGHKLSRGHHRSDCEVATDFTAGERATTSARYGSGPKTQPAGASAAWLAGWDRGMERLDNTRYQSISWEKPLDITNRYGDRVDIRIDPVPWFKERLDRYATWTANPELGFEEPWEKPLAFLFETIMEDRRGVEFGLDDHSHTDLGGMQFQWAWESRRPWNEADTRKLHQELDLEDANGNPLEVIRDPARQAVVPPSGPPEGALPLAENFRMTVEANYEFGCKYLDVARSAVRQAVEGGVDVDELLDGYPAEMRAAVLADPGTR